MLESDSSSLKREETMTDREMALGLGEYIVGLLRRISALQGVFTEYRVPTEDGRRIEIPWKEDEKRMATEPAALEIVAAQLRSLREAVGDETPESQLLRALYRHFVGD